MSIYRRHHCCCDRHDTSPMSDVEIHGWQSDSWSAIGFSRSRISLLNLKQQPTSLRDECLAGSGILQVNYSLEWVARRGVGWHAYHWGTPAPRRHLSPCASSAGVKLWGTYTRTYVNMFVRMYARGNAPPFFSFSLSDHKSLSSAWRFAKPSIFATPMIIEWQNNGCRITFPKLFSECL